MAREKRPPEVQKLFNNINRARREFIKGFERYCEVDDKIGVLPGHRIEMERRIRAFKDEVENLIRVLESKEV